MTGTLDGLGHFLLELLRSTGQTAGQNLTLLVQKLLEKFRVLVIHILDTCLLETAIFFLPYIYRNGIEIPYLRLLCVRCCHGLFLLFLFDCFTGEFVPAFFRVFHRILVLTESKEADDTLVAAVLRFESLYDGTFTRKFEEEIVSGGLLLNRIREFFKPHASSFTI